MKNTVTHIRPESLELARDFAVKCSAIQYELHQWRNPNSMEKMVHDFTIGKVAEFAVSNVLFDAGIKHELPLSVPKPKQRIYDPDIVAWVDGEEIHVHVKAKDINFARRYGMNWSFQKDEDVVKAPQEKDLLVLCTVQLEPLEIKIIASLPATKVFGLFEEPEREAARKTKCVLYHRTLKEKGLV